jgi:hypothetical protein
VIINIVETLYLRPSTPEYRQAFDLALSASQPEAEPLLVVSSSAIHAVELLKRCRAPLVFAGTGGFDAVQFAVEASDWAWGPIQPVRLAAHDRRYTRMLWAEPEVASAEATLQALSRLAVRGASMNVIASASLRRFLPAWQAAPPPAVRPLAPGPVGRLLASNGWRVERTIVFHGPRSIFWSYLARAAGRIQRPDWGDRCRFAMRRTYREAGWLWPLAPLALIQARAV